MRKFLLLASGILFFGCESTTRTETTTTTGQNASTEESVEKGAGTEVSPQLEGVEASASRLEVDTISSSTQPK